MAVFRGNTAGGQEMAKAQHATDAPFLSAGFWKHEKKIAFVVLSTHKSANGPYIGVQLVNPQTVTIDAKEHSLVRIGNLAGIALARLQALAQAKNKHFAVGDKVWLKCTGITQSDKVGHSPSPNFEIEIDRAQEAA
jgi:hypothetical protein